MSSPAAIKAVSHFTTKGQASRVSVVKELAIGMTLGLAAGLWWKVSDALLSCTQSRVSRAGTDLCSATQTYHWAEKHKIEQYCAHLPSASSWHSCACLSSACVRRL